MQHQASRLRYFEARLAVSALLITGAAARSGAAAEAYRKMSEAEIKAKVTGMEITDQAHFSEQYMRDGTVRIVTLGRRIVAKWTVKGGQLCIEAPSADDSRCAEVWVVAPKVQLRVARRPRALRRRSSKSSNRATGNKN